MKSIHQIQKDAREDNRYQNGEIPAWPIVIARLPKGWGGPRYNDWSGPKFDGKGMPIEHSFPCASSSTSVYLLKIWELYQNL